MDFPADVLVEILVRLPSISRRRARLVCRHWRDVVNERTTEMQSRAVPLIWDVDRAVAYVVDDMSSTSTGSYMELWRSASRDRPYSVQLVGTCNGLLCLCDNNVPGGAITVVNPATRETLSIPPLPCTDLFIGSHHGNKWHKAYSFAYHPTSGRYKVVHVPCSFHGVCEFDATHVFTLGDATWHEVPVGPGLPKCDDLAIGIISVDGFTHWVTGSGRSSRVVTLDLDDDNERVTSRDTVLPSLRAGHDDYHLTEVHGRLGLVTRRYISPTTEVWVLEKRRWSHRYSFILRNITQPCFTYGEYILTWPHRTSLFYMHRPKGEPSSGRGLASDDMVRISLQDEKTLVANMRCGGLFRTFAYVETTEPVRPLLIHRIEKTQE